MLQFWTLAIFYRIGDLNEFNGTGYGFDCNRVKYGEVSLDGFEDSTFYGQPGHFEFILLSETDRSFYYGNRDNFSGNTIFGILTENGSFIESCS